MNYLKFLQAHVQDKKTKTGKMGRTQGHNIFEVTGEKLLILEEA